MTNKPTREQLIARIAELEEQVSFWINHEHATKIERDQAISERGAAQKANQAAYSIVTRALSEPPACDTGTLVEIATELEAELGSAIEYTKAFQKDADKEDDTLDTLAGLLALTQKMFTMLSDTAAIGLTRMTPEGLAFDDLRFVQRAKAVFAARAPANGTASSQDTPPDAESTKPGEVVTQEEKVL